MWLATLVVLATLVALAAACPPDPLPSALASRPVDIAQLVRASYALCITSPQCTRRFHITEAPSDEPDWPLFAHLVDRLVVEMQVDVGRAAPIACGDAGAEALYAWRLVLDNYAFCTENELPDERGGCVCRRDKTCHEMAGDEFAFGRATYTLVIVVFIAAVFYYGVRATHELAALRARAPALQPSQVAACAPSSERGVGLRHGAVPVSWRV